MSQELLKSRGSFRSPSPPSFPPCRERWTERQSEKPQGLLELDGWWSGMGVPLSHSRQGQGAEASHVALCLPRHRAALCRTVSPPDAQQSATCKRLPTNNPHLHHHSPMSPCNDANFSERASNADPISSLLLGRYFSYAIQDSPRSLLALLWPGLSQLSTPSPSY